MFIARGHRPWSLAALLWLSALAPVRAADWIYAVRPGDNPWDLTERYLNGLKYWPRVQTLNQITDPLHIAPGTRLRIPVGWLRPVPAAAVVVALQGEASVSVGGARRAVSTGVRVSAGAVLTTAADSNLTLEFEDGSRMLLHADSELELRALRRFENTDMVDTDLQLRRGRTENLVRPATGAADRFEISSPSATTSVRGTEFRLAADAEQTRAEVLAGAVRVANPSARIDVEQGFGTFAHAGRPPAAPVALLPAPDLTGLPALLERMPIALSMPALAGADQYRVQIADRADFTPVRHDAVTGVNWHGPDLPDGRHYLRVRGIDAHGLEGYSADRAIEVNARPEPPVLVLPGPQAMVIETEPEFQWAAVTGISEYRLQIGRSATLDAPLSDQVATGATQKSPSTLDPGIYYWRVAAIDPAQGQGPFSDTQTFRRPPPGPAFDQPAIDDTELLVRWRAGTPGQRYRFQLAKDEAFTAPLVDATTEIAQYALPRPARGRYYLRVQTLDVDGYAGPFGAVQRLDVPGKNQPWWLLLLTPLLVLL
jgi:hypothetical protein